MTFGEKIRKLRTDANLTQKDLADKLNVTYQTVSKWETDINEPDFSTLKELAKILNCSIEYLFSDEDEVSEEINDKEEVVEENTTNIFIENPVIETPTKTKIGACDDCGKELYEGENIHHVEKPSYAGIKEIVTICDSCFTKRKEDVEKQKRSLEKPIETPEKSKNIFKNIRNRKDKKPLILSIVLCVIAFIATLVVCIIYYDSVGIWLTIGLPFIIAYCVIAELYCILSDSWIGDIFSEVASWSIRFPGIIFTFDLDGLKFLIFMKILFGVIGFFIGVATFILAVSLSTVLSVFTFIPLLIYNKKHYIDV